MSIPGHINLVSSWLNYCKGVYISLLLRITQKLYPMWNTMGCAVLDILYYLSALWLWNESQYAYKCSSRLCLSLLKPWMAHNHITYGTVSTQLFLPITPDLKGQMHSRFSLPNSATDETKEIFLHYMMSACGTGFPYDLEGLSSWPFRRLRRFGYSHRCWAVMFVEPIEANQGQS